MAASVPQGVTNNSWLEQGRSKDTKSIELGMSGMSLVSANRPPALSGSSISTVPGDDHHHRHHSFGSLNFPSSDLQNGLMHTGSGPPSPSSPLDRGAIGAFPSQNLPKPQGTLTSLLSLNGKNGTINNTLGSTSLVPTANLYSGGEHEIYGLGRQEVASSPWANVELNSNAPSYSRDVNNFDRGEDKGDMLMSLTGLRDRVHTSPGPLRNKSVSPPLPRGDLSPLTSDGRGGQQLLSDHRRMSRTPVYGTKISNTRPPLSGHLRDGILNSGSFDARNGTDTFEYSPPNGNTSNTRVEMRSDMADRLQCNPRRGGNEQYHFHEKRSAQGEHPRYENNIDHINKFGNLSNVHQQRRHSHHHISLQPPHHLGLPPGLQEIHHDDGNTSLLDSNGIVHHRLHSDGSGSSLFTGGNSESALYQRGSLPIGKLTRSISDHNAPILSRSGSSRMQNNDIQPATLRRRHTDFFYDGKQYSSQQQIHPNIQRHDNFGSGGADLGAPIMATPDEMRAFNIQEIDDRNRNAGQRYQSSSSHGTHIQAPGVTRRHSDLVNMTASGAVRSGGRYVVHSQEIRSLGLDNDLNHALAGGHIDDPDDYGIQLRSTPPGLMDSSHHHPKLAYSRSEGSQHTSAHPSRSPYMTMDSIPPTAGSSLPIPRVVYNVKFKRTQRSFIIGPRVTRDLKIGCYVKVEADRGEDLGIVVAKVPAEKFNSAARSGFRATGPQGEIGMIATPLGSPGISDLKRIIRLATHDEVSLLNVKREEEEELLKICRGKVRQRALPMHVVDAEYQFDRHKLTFFFEAEGRIDFRELVRDLFSMYKTRIWMQQLDKNGVGTGSPSVASPLPDYGNSTISQIPVMADNITEPYGISTDPETGSK